MKKVAKKKKKTDNTARIFEDHSVYVYIFL